MPKPTTRVIVAAAIVALATADDARADGWRIQLQSVKALGVGYAGIAHPEDASTVWLNAAGMSRIRKQTPDRHTMFTAAAPFIRYQLDFVDAGSRSVLGQPLDGPSRVDGGAARGLLAGYVTRRLTDRWWVGGGLNFPYGLSDDYGTAWVGRYHATRSKLEVMNFDGSVARRWDKVSVGGGVDVQRSAATLGTQIDFGSLGAAIGLPLVPQGSDGAIEVKASTWAVGYNASVSLDAHDRVRLAASFRSHVDHDLDGTATFVVPAAASAFSAGGAFQSGGARASLPMPLELTFGTAVDVTPAVVLVGDVSFVRWSRFTSFEVTFDNPRQNPLTQAADYRNSFRTAGGAIVSLGRQTIRFGGLFERVPVPDATRTPRLPESDNVALSGGWTRQFTATWDLDVAGSILIPHESPIQVTDTAAGLLAGAVRWNAVTLAVGFTKSF